MTEQTALPADDYPSFMNFEAEPMNFFAVDAVGDDDIDLARGKLLAEEGLKYSRERRNNVAVVLALLQIAQKPEHNMLELGFIIKISDAAVAGSMN